MDGTSTSAEALVRARVCLLPRAEGGRSAPIRGSYRPNHNFLGPDNRDMLVGFIEMQPDEVLNPGECAEFEILFLNWSALRPDLRVGKEWLIQEGAHVVGKGTVLERLS